MNCHKTIENSKIDEELFIIEVENAKNCISKCLNLDKIEIKEIADEEVIVALNGRKKTLCKRKIFDFGQGTLDCYLSKNYDFIEIFHHPN
jgi:hypothetical protein